MEKIRTKNGKIFALVKGSKLYDVSGRFMGRLTQSGEIISPQGQVLGKIDEKGHFVPSLHSYVTRVDISAVDSSEFVSPTERIPVVEKELVINK